MEDNKDTAPVKRTDPTLSNYTGPNIYQNDDAPYAVTAQTPNPIEQIRAQILPFAEEY